jgi:hypothetical protein
VIGVLTAILLAAFLDKQSACDSGDWSFLASIVVASLFPLDWMAFGELHPSGYGIPAVAMLVCVGTVPFRPWHTIFLGLGMTVGVTLAALVTPQLFGNNPVSLIPEFPVFMLVVTVACCGVSALIYRSRYDLLCSRRQEQELRSEITASEQKYRSLFENASDGIFVSCRADSIAQNSPGDSGTHRGRTPYAFLISPPMTARIRKSAHDCAGASASSLFANVVNAKASPSSAI